MAPRRPDGAAPMAHPARRTIGRHCVRLLRRSPRRRCVSPRPPPRMAQSDGFVASSSPPQGLGRADAQRCRCADVQPARTPSLLRRPTAHPQSIKIHLPPHGKTSRDQRRPLHHWRSYYGSNLMPDVIEVIGVRVRGSIIAAHLHIDVHSVPLKVPPTLL